MYSDYNYKEGETENINSNRNCDIWWKKALLVREKLETPSFNENFHVTLGGHLEADSKNMGSMTRPVCPLFFSVMLP